MDSAGFRPARLCHVPRACAMNRHGAGVSSLAVVRGHGSSLAQGIAPWLLIRLRPQYDMASRHAVGVKPPVTRLRQLDAEIVIVGIGGADQQRPPARQLVVNDSGFRYAQCHVLADYLFDQPILDLRLSRQLREYPVPPPVSIFLPLKVRTTRQSGLKKLKRRHRQLKMARAAADLHRQSPPLYRGRTAAQSRRQRTGLLSHDAETVARIKPRAIRDSWITLRSIPAINYKRNHSVERPS
jgi:hypothetical protein